MNYLKYTKISLLLGCLLSGEVLAIPLPGVSITGLYGDVSSVSADALIPVLAQENHLFFISPQELYHNSNEYSVSLGGGYRSLFEQWGILSAYTFADYNHSLKGNDFWFISPGVQRLGDRFDLAVNFYLPVSTQRINTGQTFADNIGINDYVSFSGHEQIDQLVNTFESVGPGGDAEVGVRLPFLTNNTKIYLGGYYFSPQDTDSILGGSTRVNVPVNRFITITASEAYDNVQHSVTKIGLTLSLGGRDSGFNYAGDLQQRLLDPIPRNLAAIAGGAHTAQPATTGEELTDKYQVELSNIWFFSPDASSYNGNCTATAPCALTQQAVNSINAVSPQANLYVESGEYTQTDAQNNLTLSPGQSLYGRDAGFTSTAPTDELPTLLGGLILTGDNYVGHIELLNDGSHTIGIVLDDNAQQVILDKVTVGNNGNIPAQAYQTGIQLGNNDSLRIQNSAINVFANQAIGDLVTGIKMDGVSGNTVIVANTTINAATSNQLVDLVGVFVGNDQGSNKVAQNNIVTLKTDTINVSGNNIARNGFGVYLGDYFADSSNLVTNNQLTILNSQIDVSAIHNIAFGILLGNFEYSAPLLNNNAITMQNSTVNVESSDSSAYGVFVGMFNGANNLTENNNLYLTNNQINVTADRFNAYGIELDGYASTFTLINNTVNAATEANSISRQYVYGVNLQGSNDVLNLIGNTINSSSNGDNVLAVSLSDGLYYADFNNNNRINAKANLITASAAGNNSNTDGVLILDSGSVVNLNNNAIFATDSGKNGAALGVNIAGDNNALTITNSTIQATATNAASSALGVAANTGYAYYGSSSNSMITLSGDSITATAAGGSAIGVFDSKESVNHNLWNISGTLIQAKGLIKSCNIDFNGICTP